MKTKVEILTQALKDIHAGSSVTGRWINDETHECPEGDHHNPDAVFPGCTWFPYDDEEGDQSNWLESVARIAQNALAQADEIREAAPYKALALLRSTYLGLHSDVPETCLCSQCEFRRAAAAVLEEAPPAPELHYGNLETAESRGRLGLSVTIQEREYLQAINALMNYDVNTALAIFQRFGPTLVPF